MRLPDRCWRLAYRLAYRLSLAWSRLHHPRSNGVWIAVWSRGEVLLVRNSYRDSLTLPGGSIGRGEPVVNAAVRELREEVGILCDPDDLLFRCSYASHSEHKQDCINLFEVAFDVRPPFHVDNREVVWGAFCKPEDALKRRLFPTLRQYLEECSSGKKPAGDAAA